MTLRNIVQFHLRQSAHPIVTIMGLTHGIGKTFISTNLANVLAHSGNKVLLIDADIHHNPVQQYFRDTNSLGLTDILYHDVSIEDAVSCSPHLDHLHLLSLGKVDKKKLDLRLSQKFNELLQSLKNQYQYIIINGTSNVCLNDNILFGIDVGMHLLLIGANLHKMHDIEMGLQNLQHVGIKVDGTIYNHIKPNKSHRYFHHMKKHSSRKQHPLFV